MRLAFGRGFLFRKLRPSRSLPHGTFQLLLDSGRSKNAEGKEEDLQIEDRKRPERVRGMYTGNEGVRHPLPQSTHLFRKGSD